VSGTGNWENIETIPGSGNTNNISSYSAIDEKPYSGVSYYRLMQTDFSGALSYSAVRSVNLGNMTTISLYPNPAAEQVFIQSANPAQLKIVLYNSNGQIMTIPAMGTGGNAVTLNVSTLATGVYFVYISQADNSQTKKLIIRR